MINLVLLGSGNVATHLFQAFSSSKKINIKQVYNHAEESLSKFKNKTEVTTAISKLKEADIYLLALKDDPILKVASQLENKQALVAHTSGTVPLSGLNNCQRKGVFYPLQTFSAGKELDYSNIPFCLEANNAKDLALLKILAGEISGVSYEVSSAQRKKLHLAAVFVCNFVNYLYSIGEDICTKNNLPFEILHPLINETAKKINSTSPKQVQTGPAIREDKNTMAAHLELLSNPEEKKIYQLLTQAIQSFHGKKL